MNAFSSRNPSGSAATTAVKDSMAIFSALEYIMTNLNTVEAHTEGISNKLIPPLPSSIQAAPQNLAEISVSEALMDILHRLQTLASDLERINSAF